MGWTEPPEAQTPPSSLHSNAGSETFMAMLLCMQTVIKTICFDFCKFMYIDNVNILRPKWIPGNKILHKQKKNAIACDVVINYMKNIPH